MENMMLEENNKNQSENERTTQIEPYKQHHLWYDGDVIKLKYRDTDVFISALGEVKLSLLDKTLEKEVLCIDGKSNEGKLYCELSKVIKNDEELNLVLNGEHPVYEIKDLAHQNYWECCFGSSGKKYSINWKLDATTITKAIVEVSKDLKDKYHYFKLTQRSLLN